MAVQLAQQPLDGLYYEACNGTGAAETTEFNIFLNRTSSTDGLGHYNTDRCTDRQPKQLPTLLLKTALVKIHRYTCVSWYHIHVSAAKIQCSAFNEGPIFTLRNNLLL